MLIITVKECILIQFGNMLIEIDTPFDQLPIKKCGLIYSSNKTSGKTQIESYQ